MALETVGKKEHLLKLSKCSISTVFSKQLIICNLQLHFKAKLKQWQKMLIQIVSVTYDYEKIFDELRVCGLVHVVSRLYDNRAPDKHA